MEACGRFRRVSGCPCFSCDGADHGGGPTEDRWRARAPDRNGPRSVSPVRISSIPCAPRAPMAREGGLSSSGSRPPGSRRGGRVAFDPRACRPGAGRRCRNRRASGDPRRGSAWRPCASPLRDGGVGRCARPAVGAAERPVARRGARSTIPRWASGGRETVGLVHAAHPMVLAAWAPFCRRQQELPGSGAA